MRCAARSGRALVGCRGRCESDGGSPGGCQPSSGEIDVGSVVSVDRLDGSRIEGVLTAKTPDSITVDVYQRRAFRRPRLVRHRHHSARWHQSNQEGSDGWTKGCDNRRRSRRRMRHRRCDLSGFAAAYSGARAKSLHRRGARTGGVGPGRTNNLMPCCSATMSPRRWRKSQGRAEVAGAVCDVSSAFLARTRFLDLLEGLSF